MPHTQLPRPWTIRHNEDAWWLEAANGAAFGYSYHRDTDIVGTGRDKLTNDLARRVTSQIAKLASGVVCELTEAEAEALDRFIASRSDRLSRAEAVGVLVRDALVGMGDLALGSADRGPGARRGR